MSDSNLELQRPESELTVWVDDVCTVSGGSPLHLLTDNLPVSTSQEVGEGKLVVSGLGLCFNNINLGRYDSVPSGLAWEYIQLYYQLVGD